MRRRRRAVVRARDERSKPTLLQRPHGHRAGIARHREHGFALTGAEGARTHRFSGPVVAKVDNLDVVTHVVHDDATVR